MEDLTEDERRALRRSKFAPLPAPPPTSRPQPRLAHPGGPLATNKAAALAKFLERKLQEPGGLASMNPALVEKAVKSAKETVNASTSSSGRVIRHVASFGDPELPDFEDESEGNKTNRVTESVPKKFKKKKNIKKTSRPPMGILSTESSASDVCWDDLGFGLVNTDFMYMMKCSSDGVFTNGELLLLGKIKLSPASGVLCYGQGLVEGLKAYRKDNGSILLFRPTENSYHLTIGANRLCMPSPTVDQFVEAVKVTVLANKRWVPPPGKGSLYIRVLLMASGPVLGLAPSQEYTFLIYVSPVGNYFRGGLTPIHLLVENEFHRATPGGTAGGIKSIANYASVLKAQSAAKAEGYFDVLYLDSIHKKYLEEVSSCNLFVVKRKTISTPLTRDTILPGITRKSVMEIAKKLGFTVEERLITVDELLDADEVFCTGTAVGVIPVGSVTQLGRKVGYERMVLVWLYNNSILALQIFRWGSPRTPWVGPLSLSSRYA